jgi:hypothetical protein
MATYPELATLIQSEDNKQRVVVAVLVKASLVNADSGATANQKTWARGIISQAWPQGTAVDVYTQLLMANRAVSVATIQNAVDNDAGLQTLVSDFLDTYLATLG